MVRLCSPEGGILHGGSDRCFSTVRPGSRGFTRAASNYYHGMRSLATVTP